MNAGGFYGQGYVGAGVDEQSSCQLPVASCQFLAVDDLYRFDCQRFEVAGGKISFAELDVVDAGAGGFRNFVEEVAAARAFIAGEGGAVSDVVEEQVVSLMQECDFTDCEEFKKTLTTLQLRSGQAPGTEEHGAGSS